MRAFGYERPVVAGEYNAPWPNLYSEAVEAMTSLYERTASLPPQLQMFLRGCPPDLEARHNRPRPSTAGCGSRSRPRRCCRRG